MRNVWKLPCSCLPTPLTLVCGGNPIIPLLVHQPDFCKYDLRKRDLFVLSWARERRIRRGSISSELINVSEVCAVFCYCLLWLDA